MIGDAFGILALGYANNLFRQTKPFLLHYLEVADYVDGGVGSNQGKTVELIVFEESVCNLDYSLLPVLLAGEVDTYGYLAFNPFESKYLKCCIYIFGWYVVKNRYVLKCDEH